MDEELFKFLVTTANGVLPWMFLISVSAFACKSNKHMSLLSSEQARCKAVKPSFPLLFTSAPKSSSRPAKVSLPAVAADWMGL